MPVSAAGTPVGEVLLPHFSPTAACACSHVGNMTCSCVQDRALARGRTCFRTDLGQNVEVLQEILFLCSRAWTLGDTAVHVCGVSGV